jgi:hypothetical protein
VNTGKNELSPEIIEAIRNVVKEEIGKVIINQHPFFGMLESEKIFAEEQDRLHEHPLKGVLGRITKVSRTEDGQTFDIKLNERGREFVNDIYEQQRLKESDLDIEGQIEWNDIWYEIYKRGD